MIHRSRKLSAYQHALVYTSAVLSNLRHIHFRNFSFNKSAELDDWIVKQGPPHGPFCPFSFLMLSPVCSIPFHSIPLHSAPPRSIPSCPIYIGCGEGSKCGVEVCFGVGCWGGNGLREAGVGYPGGWWWLRMRLSLGDLCSRGSGVLGSVLTELGLCCCVMSKCGAVCSSRIHI